MRRLTSSSLISNIFAVSAGAAAGQVIIFAFSPLIARIFSPESFGLQGVFLSLISILSPVITLRYPMAIIVAKDEQAADTIARLSLLIAFGLSCLLGLVLMAAQQQVLWLLGAHALGGLIWFLPLALFCVALQDVANFRASRLNAFRLIGVVAVAQAFITNLVRVLGGLFMPTAGILVGVTSVAPAVRHAMLRFGLRKRRISVSGLSPAEAFKLLKKYRDFPIYRMPTDVLNAASQSVPVILLAALFSPAAAGLYALTRSVMNLPSNIIGNAIGNVLYTRFAELAREGQPIMPLLLRGTVALLALTPIIVSLAWFGPTVFAFVFGEEWREAGHYARWMSIWIGVSVANVPAVRSMAVIQRQRVSLFFNIIFLVFRVLSVTSVYWIAGSAMMAIITFSIVSASMNLIMILVFGWCVIQFDREQKENSL